VLTLVSNFVGWDREFNREESTAEGCYPLSLSIHIYICVFVCIYLSMAITISGDCDVGVAVLIYI